MTTFLRQSEAAYQFRPRCDARGANGVSPEWADGLDDVQFWKELAVRSVVLTDVRSWYGLGLLLVVEAAHSMALVCHVANTSVLPEDVVAADILSTPPEMERPRYGPIRRRCSGNTFPLGLTNMGGATDRCPPGETAGLHPGRRDTSVISRHIATVVCSGRFTSPRRFPKQHEPWGLRTSHAHCPTRIPSLTSSSMAARLSGDVARTSPTVCRKQ